jgi:UDP:flavonoid glycosyltransferase YjiC (YdhE family)
MARIACTTWDGGGNVAVFRALAQRLRARGHDVSVRVGAAEPLSTDADLVLVDVMAPVDTLRAALEAGRPAATVVHCMWSFVPALEGSWAPAGYLDLLAEFPLNLVFGITELDGEPAAVNVAHVGPVFEQCVTTEPWQHADTERPLVVVSLGTTDQGQVAVVQRVLDALADLPVAVLATVGAHIDPTVLHAPSNAVVSEYVDHGVVLPNASLFVGHAGHGGIMAALRWGLPIVSMPLGNDQPHNAERLAAAGVGPTLDRDADALIITAAVDAALHDAELRTRARELATAIERHRDDPVQRVEVLLV